MKATSGLAADPSGESASVRLRLATMMFLEYAVRGTWYPFLARYLTAPRGEHGLGFTPGQTGWILGFANAVGAVTAPFIAGQAADRYLNAERALAGLHLIAAVFLFLNASSTSFAAYFAITLCFSIAYVPTQSLTNSLALSHLADPEHSYPRTRMWGTIGWMVSSSLFTYLVLVSPDRAANIARIPDALRAAAIMAIGYALYCLFILPQTPPSRTREATARGARSWAFVEAFAMMRQPAVLALTLVAMPVAAIHTAYYLNAAPFLTTVVGIPERWLGPTIAVSQTSEVLFLFTLGPLLKRFGYKALLVTGAAAQVVRFAVFAIDPPAWVVILSLTLHGVAYACFFTVAVLYIERSAPAGIRHSAQTVFGIVLFGIGPALAGPYSQCFDHFTRAGHPDYRVIWWTQAGVALASTLAVVAFFRPARRA